MEKFNDSSSSFYDIASRVKVTGVANPLYDEKAAPHIVIDRATDTSFASLKINSVVISDDGIYKIIISAALPGNSIDTEQQLNLSVFGKIKVRECLFNSSYTHHSSEWQ